MERFSIAQPDHRRSLTASSSRQTLVSSRVIQQAPLPVTRSILQQSTIVRNVVPPANIVNVETEKRQVVVHRPRETQQPIQVNVDSSSYEQRILGL